MRFPLLAMFSTFAIFSVAYSFSNLFINVYVWKQNATLFSVGLFQFFSFLFIFLAFMAGAYVIYFFGSRINFILSSVLSLSLYFYLIQTADLTSIAKISLAGALNGSYIGLFFAGLNFYSIWFSERSRVSNTVGLHYIITGMAQIVTPFLLGWVIYTYSYDHAFAIALSILGVQTLFSILTPQVRFRSPFQRKRFFWPENRRMGYLGVSAASFGFFFAFVQMSLSIFIFKFIQNEWGLGEWNTLFAFLTVGTYLLLGKTLLKPFEEMLGTIGVILSTVITFVLFIPSPITFIVFNAIISVSLPMVWRPSFAQQFRTIRSQTAVRSSNGENPLTKTMELLVYREFTLCIGRLAFFALLICSQFFVGQNFLFLLIVLLCFMPTATFVLSQKSKG
jgi:hypothetical protein